MIREEQIIELKNWAKEPSLITLKNSEMKNRAQLPELQHVSKSSLEERTQTRWKGRKGNSK